MFGPPAAAVDDIPVRGEDSERPRSGRLVLFGLFGVGNLGNDSTLWSVLHHLRRRLPNVDVSCICAELPEFADGFCVAALPLDPLPPPGRWRIGNRAIREGYVGAATLVTEPLRRRRISRALVGVDQLIVVGTGVLDDYGEFPWTLPAWLLRWCSGAKRLGAQVEMLSVGAGPIGSIWNRALLLSAARLADTRSYRDAASRDYLTACGLDTGRDSVLPDLAFGFPPDSSAGPCATGQRPRSIGIGLMGYYGWRNDPDLGRDVFTVYVRKMADFVTWLLRQGYQVHLLIGEVRSDTPAVDALTSILRSTCAPALTSSLVVSPISNVRELLNEIERTDLVVASRFHNLVHALALGRPSISVGYSQKFEPLMAGMNLAEYCHRIDSLDVEKLITSFSSMVSDYPRLCATISEIGKQYRSTLDSVFDRTFSPQFRKTTTTT